MEGYFNRVYNQISEFLTTLSPAKKVAVVGTSGVIFAGIAALFIWAGDNSFKPLMTDLNPEDSARVINTLQGMQIPFRVESGGKVITVPPEHLDRLRMELATKGLPESGSVGYEVFDKQSLGATSFVQKVNQKRALEGELMRTIGSIRGVRRSRVHLAIPTKSTFVEDQKKPTASVVLDLEAGSRLNEKQIFGIGTLVARAVEGMDIADVVVVDSNGKTLSKNPSDPLAAATANQFEFQQHIEKDLEKRVEAMLSRVVGEGRVVAQVNADVDFSQVSETQILYDADGSAVRSTQRDIKSAEASRPGPVGPAGAAANLPGRDPAAVEAQQVRTDTKTEQERLNYAVPQTTRRMVKPTWSLRKISVAVLVDGKPVKTTDESGAVLSKVEPWSPEKLKEFEGLVASAIGLDKKRGDSLEIKNMEFTETDFDEAERMIAASERNSYIRHLILYGVIGLITLLFFLFVVRPFVKWITDNTVEGMDTFLPQTIEELEKLQKNSGLPGMEDVVPSLPDSLDPEKVEGEMIREKIITLVDSNPHKAALILRDWLHEPARKASETTGENPRTA